MKAMAYMLHSFKSTTHIKVQEPMNTLSVTTLNQFGFMEDSMKSNQIIKVFTKDKLEIILKDNSFYYSNMGIDYPLNDLSALKKLYKENRKTELKPVF
ncbi:MAG: hypothetical protein K0S53_817 [Bacteroidetes bacterium]|jgi:hypothetical protein|nr:hypothetical protein [Bacteroidota bacterium]